jgi:hypothetical protein
MSAHIAKTAGRWTGIVACGAVGGFLSAYAATMGATTTGLREGGWNWQFLPFVFGGWFFGAIIALVAIVLSVSRNWSLPLQLLVPVVAPPAIAFVGGAVSLPILIRAGEAEARRGREQFQASKAKYEALYEQLRRDPEIALREKWFELYDEHGRAFGDSLKDPTVPYTLSLLRRFYTEAPVTRDAIFAHPACDAAFLTDHYQEAYERAKEINYGMLAAIVSNPNTPRELVERVATSETLPWGAVEPAQRNLKRSTP